MFVGDLQFYISAVLHIMYDMPMFRKFLTFSIMNYGSRTLLSDYIHFSHTFIIDVYNLYIH